MTDFEDYGLIYLIIFICLHLFSLHSEAVLVPSNARYTNFKGRSFEHDVDFELFCADIRMVSGVLFLITRKRSPDGKFSIAIV